MTAPQPRSPALPFAALLAGLIWLGLLILSVVTLVVVSNQARAQGASPAPSGAVTLTFRPPQGTLPAPRREGVTALPPGAALLTELIGTVEARASAITPFTPAEPGLVLTMGSGLQTGGASQARLDLDDGAVVRVGPNTLLTVVEFATPGGRAANALGLDAGQIWANLRSRPLELHTALGVATAHGAFVEFVYRPGAPGDTTDDVLIVNCFKGPCLFQSATANEVVGDLTRLTILAEGPGQEASLTDADVQAFVRVNPEGEALTLLLGGVTPTALAVEPTEPLAETEDTLPAQPTLTRAPSLPTVTAAPTASPSATASPTEASETPETPEDATASPTGEAGTPGTPGTPDGSASPSATTGTPGTPGTPSGTPPTPSPTVTLTGYP